MIIAGNGIAGCTLAMTLDQRNIPFILVGKKNDFSSSRVAAGISNPVVFRRLNPSWMVDNLMRSSFDFYKNLNLQVDQPLVSPITINKLIRSDEEVDFWKKRINDPEISSYVDLSFENEFDPSHFHDYQAIGISKGFRLRTNLFLNSVTKYLRNSGRYIEEELNCDDLHTINNQVLWKDLKAKMVIFCEGHEVVNNPYFNHIPMQPALGDVIEIEIQDPQLYNIVHDKVSICPLDKNTYWVGSTFDWKNTDVKGTDEGREYLEDCVKKILKAPFKVKRHYAGIRPAISDRRPVLGLHSKSKQLGIFNGLGTKGSMLAPYFASHLADHLFEGKELMTEVDLKRFDNRLSD